MRRVVGDMSLDAREQLRPGDISYFSAVTHWSVIMGDKEGDLTRNTLNQGNTNGVVGCVLLN